MVIVIVTVTVIVTAVKVEESTRTRPTERNRARKRRTTSISIVIVRSIAMIMAMAMVMVMVMEVWEGKLTGTPTVTVMTPLISRSKPAMMGRSLRSYQVMGASRLQSLSLSTTSTCLRLTYTRSETYCRAWVFVWLGTLV